MTMKVYCWPKTFSLPLKIWKSHLQLGGMSTPHNWPELNGKPWVKNQADTVSHVKPLYQFIVFVEAYPYPKKAAS